MSEGTLSEVAPNLLPGIIDIDVYNSFICECYQRTDGFGRFISFSPKSYTILIFQKIMLATWIIELTSP